MINRNNAAIVGFLVEEYPGAEAEIAKGILEIDNSKVQKGKGILQKYDLTSQDLLLEKTITIDIFKMNILLFIFIATIISTSFLILFYLFLKGHYRKIEEVTKYAQNVQNKDYSLDIRDNSEGDISILKNEIYRITTMLKEQAEVLHNDKMALANSIADISHQLKTPMTSLFVINDLLYETPPDEVRIEFLNRMRSQLKRIDWLVSSLLKLSKLDAGTIVMKKENVNVKKLIDRALEEMTIPLEIKMQRITIEGDEDSCFMGDFNWSREAIINILKNCIEHTPEGGSIHISFEENPIYTAITIKDTGRGIEKEDIPYIFNRFYRGRNASADSVGIGLAMSHAIIENQMGDIVVSSEKNQGTEFKIKFFKGII
ncbi:HAMP domain-containing histidine kinase [Alkaliphilus serpentinus]|uniref:histidine kinase n=2 Tax=Alkaliphilus serpentinus TaxID=1482731 RepID=A0A833HMV1_9FIRM|nr:HAMP domain-containing histidine kinase [Alkaliphilus serpentinus]